MYENTLREAIQLTTEWDTTRRLTLDLLDAIAEAGIDPCGEHGEYHTVVLDAPHFASPLDVTWGEQVLVHGCWAADLAVSHAVGV